MKDQGPKSDHSIFNEILLVGIEKILFLQNVMLTIMNHPVRITQIKPEASIIC